MPLVLPEPPAVPLTSAPTTIGSADAWVAAWVARQLNLPAGFGPCSAIGVAIEGRMIAGAVYHDYRDLPRGRTMQASIAAVTPRWATRRTLRDMFAYPFGQVCVARLWVSVARNNRRSRSLAERLGFKLEGVARRAHDGVTDAFVYSMLADECRWVK